MNSISLEDIHRNASQSLVVILGGFADSLDSSSKFYDPCSTKVFLNCFITLCNHLYGSGSISYEQFHKLVAGIGKLHSYLKALKND